MLVRLENGIPTAWPVTEAHMQHMHPNTSFALPATEETLAEFGYGTFEYSDPATYNAEFEVPKELPPVLTNGKWKQAWEIIEKYTTEEKATYISARDAQATEFAKTAYQLQRKSEYPPMEDYLDGIVKGDQAQVQAYIDACQAVKAKYPKPA